jgi:aromatic ring-opening dioxygenase catalytic subunit (LigB family)
MLYDYYGFPEAAYKIEWPAPGAPTLATRVRHLLGERHIKSAEDPKRGFDHGTFVPLKLSVPGADIPTTQLSLVRGLDPKTHLEIGRALAPLRAEGVLIVGSGMSYHNMRGFGSRAGYEAAKLFDAWLAHAMAQTPADRAALLERWEEAPAARACHPREEHLLPLHVVAGAGEAGKPSIPFRDALLGTTVSAIHFV